MESPRDDAVRPPESPQPQPITSRLAPALCLTGAVVVITGGVLPYAKHCTSCSALAPTDTPLNIYLILAAQILGIVVLAIAFGIRLGSSSRRTRYEAGFVTALGIMAMLEFVPFAIHPGFPNSGGTFGVGGTIGMIGGAFILGAGLIETRRTHQTYKPPD